MKKLICSIIFIVFTIQVQSQTILEDLLESKNWINMPSSQLAKLKGEHQNYDLILISEEKAGMFWGDVVKLDTLNNYRNYNNLQCGTPPYANYNVTGNWNVANDILCIDILAATLDCTYGKEECEKYEENF